MADIDIVPKHRSYVWLWIIIAIIIVAIVWFLVSRSGTSGAPGVGLMTPSVKGAAVLAAPRVVQPVLRRLSAAIASMCGVCGNMSTGWTGPMS